MFANKKSHNFAPDEIIKMDLDLYLAVPKRAYDTIFQKDLVKQLVVEHKVHIVVYSDKNQTIISWIKQ